MTDSKEPVEGSPTYWLDRCMGAERRERELRAHVSMLQAKLRDEELEVEALTDELAGERHHKLEAKHGWAMCAEESKLEIEQLREALDTSLRVEDGWRERAIALETIAEELAREFDAEACDAWNGGPEWTKHGNAYAAAAKRLREVMLNG